MEKLKVLGSLFYVVNPYETMFEKVSDIPTPDWTAKVPNCALYKKRISQRRYIYVEGRLPSLCFISTEAVLITLN